MVGDGEKRSKLDYIIVHVKVRIRRMKMSDLITDLTNQIMIAAAIENERRILAELIGSRILEFELKPIKNRKTLYDLIIITDAKEVELLDPLELVPKEFDPIIPKNKAKAIVSSIKLRVKL